MYLYHEQHYDRKIPHDIELRTYTFIVEICFIILRFMRRINTRINKHQVSSLGNLILVIKKK